MKIQSATFAVEADVPRQLAVVPRKADGGQAASQALASDGSGPAAPAAGTQQVPSPQSVQTPRQDVAGGNDAEQQQLAEQLQRYLRQNSSKLDIALDKDLNMIVTKVLSSETGEVLKQYPPESVVEVLKFLRQQKGTLFNEKG